MFGAISSKAYITARRSRHGPHQAINTRRELALLPFHDLDAVAERIAHVGAVVTLDRFVINNREPGGAARLHDGVESLDQQSRMRFGRRPEVRVDTEVDPHDVVAEPASTPFR